MGFPLILGVIGFLVITIGLGTMITAIGATAGTTLKETSLRDFFKHSYGFGIAAIPGTIVGFGVYVLSRVFMPFL